MGYNEVILADAPVVYWKLSEAAGGAVMVDSSGNGHDGGYSGSPTLGQAGLLTEDTTTGETSTLFTGSALGLYGVTVGDAPAGYWKLTENSGTVMLDSSGRSRNGTYTGAQTFSQTGLLSSDAAAGEKSIQYGTGSYGGVNGTWLNAPQVTVEVICHPDSVTSSGTIAERWLNIPVAANHYWSMNYSTVGFTWCVKRVSDGASIFTDSPAAAGSTYRVTGTYGDGTARLYLNGALVKTMATGTGPVATTGNSQEIYVGANEYILNTSPFHGRIEKVAFFDRILSSAEIAARSWASDVNQNVFNQWLNMPTISVEAIVNPTVVNSAGYQMIVERDNNNDQGAPGRIWNLIMSSGHPSWTIYTGQTKFVNVSDDTLTMVPGTTYHLVGTYDGAVATLYVNGVAKASKPIAGPLYQPSIQGVAVGNRDVLGNPFGGKIEKVSIYNKALTPQQVATHYAATDPGGLVPVLVATGLTGTGATGGSLGTDAASTFFIGTTPR